MPAFRENDGQPTGPMITFDTDPSRYRHWRLACDGPIATLTLDVAEEGGLSPGYRLKLNSYDLGVDIELQTRSTASVSSTPRWVWWS